MKLRTWAHVLCCMVLVWCAFTPAYAADDLQELNQAEVQTSPGVWTKVDLPHAWSRQSPPWEGIKYYRWRFDLPNDDTQSSSWAVYIPRAGNRYALRLNGQPIGATGQLDDLAQDHVHQPNWFALPRDVLSEQGNVLELELHGEKARYAGVSRIWIGPAAQIQSMQQARRAWLHGGALVMMGLSLVIGIMAIGFGLVMGARSQWLFGVAALLWALRQTYVLTTSPLWTHPWWNMSMDVLYGVSVVLLCESAMRTLRIVNGLWGRVLHTATWMSMAFPCLYAWTGSWAVRQIFLSSLLLCAVGTAVFVIQRWRNQRTLATTALGSAALLATGLGLYDHVLIMWLPHGYDLFALSRFSFLFMLLALSVVLMHRVIRALNTARRFRLRLQGRFRKAQHTLQVMHEAREQERVQEAELAERLRWLGQMHDGVGSHLTVLQSLLLQPRLSRENLQYEVAQAGLALRDSLQILQGTPETWTGCLASLRDTLETRLNHAGICLIWKVDCEPEIRRPDVHDYQHLRLWLSEAISNVIKHAQAHTVTVFAGLSQDGVNWEIGVLDDGQNPVLSCGHGYGHGLKTMTYRATALGASNDLVRTDKGTRVSLSWKIHTSSDRP